MKQIFKMAFLFPAVIFFSACSKDSNSSVAPIDQKPAPRVERRTETFDTTLINGEKPVDFYRTFVFSYFGSCHDNSLWYRLAASDTVYLGKAPNGRDIVGAVKVMLHANGEFHATYSEGTQLFLGGNSYSSDVRVVRTIHNFWTLEGTSLLLPGLGIANGMLYNGGKSLRLTLDRDFVTPGLKGKSILLRQVISNGTGIPSLELCRN